MTYDPQHAWERAFGEPAALPVPPSFAEVRAAWPEVIEAARGRHAPGTRLLIDDSRPQPTRYLMPGWLEVAVDTPVDSDLLTAAGFHLSLAAALEEHFRAAVRPCLVPGVRITRTVRAADSVHLPEPHPTP